MVSQRICVLCLKVGILINLHGRVGVIWASRFFFEVNNNNNNDRSNSIMNVSNQARFCNWKGYNIASSTFLCDGKNIVCEWFPPQANSCLLLTVIEWTLANKYLFIQKPLEIRSYLSLHGFEAAIEVRVLWTSSIKRSF